MLLVFGWALIISCFFDARLSRELSSRLEHIFGFHWFLLRIGEKRFVLNNLYRKEINQKKKGKNWRKEETSEWSLCVTCLHSMLLLNAKNKQNNHKNLTSNILELVCLLFDVEPLKAANLKKRILICIIFQTNCKWVEQIRQAYWF